MAFRQSVEDISGANAKEKLLTKEFCESLPG